MARNIINYRVEDEGRDLGKVFVITEMGAQKAESWAMRVLLAVMATDVQIPEGFELSGSAGLAELGFRAFSKIPWEISKPLLDEMMQGVKIIPDPSRMNIDRPLIDQDIEEVQTLVLLRMEVWRINMGFLNAETFQSFGEKIKSKSKERKPKTSRT